MEYMIGAGGRDDNRAIALETRKKRWIANEQRMQRVPASMMAAAQLHTGSHPAWQVHSLRSDYDCMGMVFAARRSWVDPDQFNMIAEDDGYQKVSRHQDARVGDVAVYWDSSGSGPVHVGLVVEVKPNVAKAEVGLLVPTRRRRRARGPHVPGSTQTRFRREACRWSKSLSAVMSQARVTAAVA